MSGATSLGLHMVICGSLAAAAGGRKAGATRGWGWRGGGEKERLQLLHHALRLVGSHGAGLLLLVVASAALVCSSSPSSKGCSLPIQEDLLNNYAEQMLNYFTAASNSTLNDALDPSLYLVNEKEQHILQLENKLDFVCSQLSDYKDKHVAHDKAHDNRLEDEKCKSRKYCTLFWFMLISFLIQFRQC